DLGLGALSRLARSVGRHGRRILMNRSWPTKLAALAVLALALPACTQDGGSVQITGSGDFLPVEQAFPYTAAADADSVALRFDLPDGYYLYRNMFGFSSRNADVALDSARFPQGNVIWDEFKEENLEIYRGEFAIEIPYRRGADVASLPLTLKLQGCADAGLCYVPQTWQTDIALPASAQAGIALFGESAGASASTELLALDEAFQLDARFD